MVSEYTGGYEIFEGHHRLAACLVIGILEVEMGVLNERIEVQIKGVKND